MFDYVEFHYEMQKNTVKQNKKAIRYFVGLNVFNVSVLIWDIYSGVHGSIANQIAIECMIMNSIWSFLYLLEYLGEQKHDKKLLRYYDERKAEKNTVEALEEYRRAKEFYERAAANLERESSCAGESNNGVQPAMCQAT